MKKNFKWSMLAMVTLIHSSVSAGWNSNGGDSQKDQNNPWFIARGPVTYCIEASPDYALDTTELAELVAEAFRDWKQFFEKYGLNEKNFRHDVYRFRDQQPKGIELDFQAASTCDVGGKQLKFLFGIRNDIVDSLLKTGSSHSVGLAIRPDYDHRTLRHGGYIWIRNFGSNHGRIKHVVLHEIGHVLGLKHDSVFVMDEYIADRISSFASDSNLPFGEIETPTWKYDYDARESFSLTYNRSNKVAKDGKYYIDGFHMPRVLSRQFLTNPNARFSLALTYKSFVDALKIHIFDLAIREEGKDYDLTYSMHVKPSDNVRMLDFGIGLFTEWFNTAGESLGFRELPLDPLYKPRSWLGNVQLSSGKTAVTLDYNRGPVLRLFVSDTGEWWEIR